MATYLLLRNNKESGPYNLDDLVHMGLKAYDLVWIQGKSAAWRYPSEVEELKAIAPVVEEQPYDRFFKKPSGGESTPVITHETVAESPQIQKDETAIPVKPEHEKYLPKKSVFVTMPAKKAAPVPSPQPAAEKQAGTTSPEPVPQTISITENPAAAQVKYSQPLDEIKEMYVKTLQDRKQKMARKSFWMKSLRQAGVILALVTVGVVTGFMLKGNRSQTADMTLKQADHGNTTRQPAAVPLNENATSESGETIDNSIPRNGDRETANANIEGSQAKKDQPQVNTGSRESDRNLSTPVDENPGQRKPVQADLPGDPKAVYPEQNASVNPATGERTRKTRAESMTDAGRGNAGGTKMAEGQKPSLTGEFGEQVSVSANDYKKVPFGGIRNLEITVTNDSKFTLDNVLVELQYIKPSEQPLRTENVEFKSIAPRSTATLRIPDTNRGIRVSYRIIHIRSRQMDEVASGN